MVYLVIKEMVVYVVLDYQRNGKFMAYLIIKEVVSL